MLILLILRALSAAPLKAPLKPLTRDGRWLQCQGSRKRGTRELRRRVLESSRARDRGLRLQPLLTHLCSRFQRLRQQGPPLLPRAPYPTRSNISLLNGRNPAPRHLSAPTSSTLRTPPRPPARKGRGRERRRTQRQGQRQRRLSCASTSQRCGSWLRMKVQGGMSMACKVRDCGCGCVMGGVKKRGLAGAGEKK